MRDHLCSVDRAPGTHYGVLEPPSCPGTLSPLSKYSLNCPSPLTFSDGNPRSWAQEFGPPALDHDRSGHHC